MLVKISIVYFLIEENNENLWNSEKCFWMVVIAYSIQFAGNKSDFAYSAPFLYLRTFKTIWIVDLFHGS